MRSQGFRPRCTPLARSVATALVLATASAAHAQLRADEVEGSVLRPGALAHAGAVPAQEPGNAVGARSFSETNFGASGWLGATVQLEVPRDAVTGQYTRPKFVVGLQSDSMKGWLNSTGLITERCLLPMLRARTRMTSEGDVDGTLWLYARCTFR